MGRSGSWILNSTAIPNDDCYAYVTVLNGDWAGRNFPLNEREETRIGRGANCTITVNDPLCSRVHAVLTREHDRWIVRDAQSRNGTLVNDQKIDEATVSDGHTIKIGSTEMVFHITDQPATTSDGYGLTQTIVQDVPVVAPDRASQPIGPLPNADQIRELMLLYQLSIKLLGCESPEIVVQSALDLLHERTKAAVVGYLAVTDDGQLRPKFVVPETGSEEITLNQSLTKMVLDQGRAVWVANQSTSEGVEGDHYADAVCAPLLARQQDGTRRALGAIHVYLKDGHFRQSDFDFAISLANIVAVALAHARDLTALQSTVKRLISQQPAYDELVR